MNAAEFTAEFNALGAAFGKPEDARQAQAWFEHFGRFERRHFAGARAEWVQDNIRMPSVADLLVLVRVRHRRMVDAQAAADRAQGLVRCPLCDDTTWHRFEERGHWFSEPCECRPREGWEPETSSTEQLRRVTVVPQTGAPMPDALRALLRSRLGAKPEPAEGAS